MEIGLGGQTCKRSDAQRVVGDNSLTTQFTNESLTTPIAHEIQEIGTRMCLKGK